jgi:hypothetical protein
MANGFRYESPLNRLLSITVPKFLEGQLEREHRERISEREFTYRETQDQLDRNREQEALKLEAKRYDASIIESEDDERYLRSASIFEDTRKLYPNISRQIKAFKAIDITKVHPEVATRIESYVGGLEERITDITSTMGQYNSIKVYSDLDRKRIQSAFMEGKDGHTVGDDILRNKFSTPYIKVQASLIGQKLGVLYKDISEAQEVLLVTTDEDQQKIIKSTISGIQAKINTEENKIHGLYGQDKPFDPDDYSRSFSIDLKSSLKKAGIKVDDADSYAKIVGAEGRYSTELQAFNEEFVTGINAKGHTKEERDAAVLQIKNFIIEEEKKLPPEEDEEFDYSNINRLDPAGTALLAYGGYKLAKGPTVKAYNYLTGKAVQASKHIKFVTGMPSKDVISFMESANSNRVGSIGRSMPSIEKAKNLVESLSDEPRSKAYKDAVKTLSDRVKSVSTSLKNRGIVTNIKDADLEKLLKNSDKWRLAKVRARFVKAYPGLKRGATKWGVISASAKIGEALGDPTGGIATAVGTGSAIKGIKNIYKKKGPKWLMSKLAPVVTKSVAKRIVGGFAAGAPGGPTAIAGAIAGAGFVVYDLYQFFESLSKGGSEEEAVAVLQNAMQRDSTQAQIDSARVADSTNWMLPAIK